MKYAKLVKLGGELIEAKDADYQDYYGILTCPECGEPVFLRKGHQRGETAFRAAFVHHRAIPEVSACEMRVGKYSPEYVARVAGEARSQRLRMLEISMWKYLKTNRFLNLERWAEADKRVRSSPKAEGFSRLIIKLLDRAPHAQLDAFDSRVAYLQEGKAEHEMQSPLYDFLATKKRDWSFHCKITKEALIAFLSSELLGGVKIRFIRFLCFKEVRKSLDPSLAVIPHDLSDGSTKTREWIQTFNSHLLYAISTTFLTVDWIEVLNVEQKPLAAKGRGEY